jgi:hypothetical protein
MNNDPGCTDIFPDVEMKLAENTNCRADANPRNELIGSDTPTFDADRRCACTLDKDLDFRVASCGRHYNQCIKKLLKMAKHFFRRQNHLLAACFDRDSLFPEDRR